MEEATQIVGWVGIDVTIVETIGIEEDGLKKNDPIEGAIVLDHNGFWCKDLAPEIIFLKER